MQEKLGRDDLIEELYWDTSIYANEQWTFRFGPVPLLELVHFGIISQN